MTGNELNAKLHYLGVERDLRELALKSQLIEADKLALMSTIEVCDLVIQNYQVIFCEKETIGLVKNEDIGEYLEIVKFIKR